MKDGRPEPAGGAAIENSPWVAQLVGIWEASETTSLEESRNGPLDVVIEVERERTLDTLVTLPLHLESLCCEVLEPLLHQRAFETVVGLVAFSDDIDDRTACSPSICFEQKGAECCSEFTLVAHRGHSELFEILNSGTE